MFDYFTDIDESDVYIIYKYIPKDKQTNSFETVDIININVDGKSLTEKQFEDFLKQHDTSLDYIYDELYDQGYDIYLQSI